MDWMREGRRDLHVHVVFYGYISFGEYMYGHFEVQSEKQKCNKENN